MKEFEIPHTTQNVQNHLQFHTTIVPKWIRQQIAK
jgi:hypothetical protein